MSEANVEIVRAAIDAYNRGDWDAALKDAAPDVEWVTDPRVPNAGTYRGRVEVRRFHEDQAAPFDESTIEVQRLAPKGERVAALVKLRRRPKGSSTHIEAEVGHLYSFRDGQVVRVQSFAEHERAFEAAGLSE